MRSGASFPACADLIAVNGDPTQDIKLARRAVCHEEQQYLQEPLITIDRQGDTLESLDPHICHHVVPVDSYTLSISLRCPKEV